MPPARGDAFLDPLLGGGAGRPYRLENERAGAVVADRLFAALDSAARRRGLLGRSGLESGTALVIAPTNAIHTFFMQFDIDVAFVARDGRIVKIRHRLRPWRMAGAWRARSVVELPPGTLARVDARVGDRLVIRPG